MKHFPIFINTHDKRICLIGNDDEVIAKARLVAKTQAVIEIYAPTPDAVFASYIAESGDRFVHHERLFELSDITDKKRPHIAFAYLSDVIEEAIASLQDNNVPYCVIDNLGASGFTTPALIDRTPLTIAIGTEGTAPVLARRLKKDLEDRLPHSYGVLAKIAGRLRAHISEHLMPAQRRHFWSRYFDSAHSEMTEAQAADHATKLLASFDKSAPALQQDVWYIGTNDGVPDLLTMQARHILHQADVILADQDVSQAMLELCRREADIITIPATDAPQQIATNCLSHSKDGRHIVRLIAGDVDSAQRHGAEIAALAHHKISAQIAAFIPSQKSTHRQRRIAAAHRSASKIAVMPATYHTTWHAHRRKGAAYVSKQA